MVRLPDTSLVRQPTPGYGKGYVLYWYNQVGGAVRRYQRCFESKQYGVVSGEYQCLPVC